MPSFSFWCEKQKLPWELIYESCHATRLHGASFYIWPWNDLSAGCSSCASLGKKDTQLHCHTFIVHHVHHVIYCYHKLSLLNLDLYQSANHRNIFWERHIHYIYYKIPIGVSFVYSSPLVNDIWHFLLCFLLLMMCILVF